LYAGESLQQERGSEQGGSQGAIKRVRGKKAVPSERRRGCRKKCGRKGRNAKKVRWTVTKERGFQENSQTAQKKRRKEPDTIQHERGEEDKGKKNKQQTWVHPDVRGKKKSWGWPILGVVGERKKRGRGGKTKGGKMETSVGERVKQKKKKFKKGRWTGGLQAAKGGK